MNKSEQVLLDSKDEFEKLGVLFGWDASLELETAPGTNESATLYERLRKNGPGLALFQAFNLT